MGWKVSALIVSKQYAKVVTELTKDLGFGESSISKEVLLSEVLYPDQFCIGFYNGCTIITHAAILNDFFNPSPSEMEQKFCKLFNDTEVLVVGQIENVGISGFSYIKNGQRYRTRLEGEEEGVIIETGTALKEEQNKDIYELPFIISEMLLGCKLDDVDILEVKMIELKRS